MDMIKIALILFIQSIIHDVSNGETCEVTPECALWDFECRSGHCINMRYFCDGKEDCPDGSDETSDGGKGGCSNVLNNSTLKCTLPGAYKCDGIDHCDEKADENEEACGDANKYVLSCTRIGHCVNKYFLNCAERPEWSCSKKIRCQGNICTRVGDNRDAITDVTEECEELPIFRCNSGECLTAEKFCDGIIHCPDGSDEIIANATTAEQGIGCSNKWNGATMRCVLPEHHVCDKIDHCDERLDECQPGCESSFICNNGKCLSAASLPYKCNGKDDCGDSSDECLAGCDEKHNAFHCRDGTCIAIELFCDGHTDCPDGSDEMQKIELEESSIFCSSRHNPSSFQCVLPKHHVCDEARHCMNGEDELHCADSRWFKCANNRTVDATTKVCDFKDSCCDSSDECGVPGCNRTFECPNTGKCLAFERFCDGHDDCGDGSDELHFNSSGVMCNNLHNDVEKSCVLPNRYVCDGLGHCLDRKDECTPGCRSSFICNNGECLPRDRLCDGKYDCKDQSDELTSVQGFKCAVKHQYDDVTRSCVLPQYLLHDSVLDCRDQSDVCQNEGTCFKCLTENFFVGSQQVCDGVIDCPDFSDECLCDAHSDAISRICDRFCPIDSAPSCGQCGVNEISCDNGTKCIHKSSVCDGIEQCDDSIDEGACIAEDQNKEQKTLKADFECPQEDNKFAVKCDGIPECLLLEDECEVVKETALNINGTGRKRRGKEPQFVCGDKTPEICKNLYNPITTLFHCPGRNHLFLFKNSICDGIEDCPKDNQSDIAMDEKGCLDRFECSKSRPKEEERITIHKSRLCDQRIDCEDEEDESPELCNGRGQLRFYCENRSNHDDGTKLGPLFVSKQEVLDGKNDCWDGSDECPTQLFRENTFSSRHRMIRNVILSGLVWVMGVLALLGNFVVMLHSIMKLRSRRRFSPMMKSNYILVFNLAAADFLMGVYLLALAIKNAATSGSYCRVDRDWRSGLSCSALGSLAMVSIQSSVFFLVLLTTYRMLAVLRPFRVDSLRVRYTVGCVILAWFLALVLAIVPRLTQFEEYFTSSVWISSGVYFFDTNTPTKREIGKFAQTLMAYSNGTHTSGNVGWGQIRDVIKDSYPTNWPKLEILGEFGYYSAHSVCLPKLFVTVNDSAWAYSVAIMTFDLASFIYIVTSYRVIYHDATRQGALRTGNDSVRLNDENRTLQARITRLVLTDFLCLVPVCLTAFLSIIGVEISPIAYAVAAIVLLPINSALNPILYSNVLNVLYSSCATPVTAFVTKRIVRRQRRKKRHNGGDLPFLPRGHNCFSYKQCKVSLTSNDEPINPERLRLGSNVSTTTSNQINMSVATTNTKF